MAISPTSVANMLNLAPPTSPGTTVTADKALSNGVAAGTLINLPYDFLPGGSHGTEPDVLRDGAQQVVPVYDGTNYNKTSLPANQPATFGSAPGSLNPNDFASWNSAYQAEYVKAHQPSPNGQVTIGSGSSVIHVVLASTNDRVYVMDNLQKTDFAKMPVVDQMNIAATSFFTTTLQGLLNVTLDSSTAISSINGYLTALGLAPPASPPATQAQLDSYYNTLAVAPTAVGGNTPDATPVSLASMSADDRKPFIDELKLLAKQIRGMSIFSLQDLATATKAITDRLALAARFSGFTQTAPATSVNRSGASGLVCVDGNATIVAGYKNLIAQETQIRNVAVAADNLVQTAMVSNKKLDAPTLIFYFQLDANLSQEASINASTEEVKQLNALLNLYSQMQGIINQTLEADYGTDAKTKHGLLGLGKDDSPDNWTSVPTSPAPSDQAIIAIFEDVMGNGTHPLETMYGIKKPKLDMVNNSNGNLNTNLKDTWNAFNSSLSDTVSQLNQQSQLKMNDINSATKQKDRHFDLANNSLSKMNDMIQTIARGLA